MPARVPARKDGLPRRSLLLSPRNHMECVVVEPYTESHQIFTPRGLQTRGDSLGAGKRTDKSFAIPLAMARIPFYQL